VYVVKGSEMSKELLNLIKKFEVWVDHETYEERKYDSSEQHRKEEGRDVFVLDTGELELKEALKEASAKALVFKKRALLLQLLHQENEPGTVAHSHCSCLVPDTQPGIVSRRADFEEDWWTIGRYGIGV
jgi:hypothetical protein